MEQPSNEEQKEGINDLQCSFCQQLFPSKTQLYRHLPLHGVETKSTKLTKVVLLVGWISKVTDFDDVWVKEQAVADARIIDTTAQEVEEAVLLALAQLGQSESESGNEVDRLKGFSRGCGFSQRVSLLLSGEPHSHSLSDTFACNVKPLRAGVTKETWLEELNAKLPEHIHVHECYFLSSQAAREFHAETDCSQRRVECLLPLSVIMPREHVKMPDEPIVRRRQHRAADIDQINPNAKMDMFFPMDNEDGQLRVNFFRKLKTVFKAMAGKRRLHNYVTAGATPSEVCTARRLDRVYHKEIVNIDGEEWIVLSVSGDSLLRGQVRKLLGLSLLLSLDLLPMEYLEASMDPLHVLDVPAIPGWCLYTAECRYAKWEAKYTEYRIDPRRAEPPVHNASLSDWNERLHRHIVNLHHEKGSHWMQELQNQAPVLLERYHRLRQFWTRDEQTLQARYALTFGDLELEKPEEKIEESDNIAMDVVVEEPETALASPAVNESSGENMHFSAATTTEEQTSTPIIAENEEKSMTKEEDTSYGKGKKDKRKGQDRGGRNKQKLRKGEKATIDMADGAQTLPAPDSSSVAVTTGTSALLNGRIDAEAYRARTKKLSFVHVPSERDDTPQVYRRVLHLLRAADRSNLWPSSSTGRQMVIETDTLVENGGRGGSFSVGALPRHMPAPRGNELFPELMRACFELERALLPHRPPSATIAINRHAQFLPHRDTGAGAGQSKSLIVALGCFVGGEIMVDNDVHDIRYQALEFDGWNSIHCTMPFVGERYSLVWFTPLGLTEEDMWWLRDMSTASAATVPTS